MVNEYVDNEIVGPTVIHSSNVWRVFPRGRRRNNQQVFNELVAIMYTFGQKGTQWPVFRLPS